MAQLSTYFENHFALSKLPYFTLLPGDRLALRDPELGPVVDFHTHLALAYVRPMQVDLRRALRTTEHYLSMERPVELDIYMNRNFSAEDLARMRRDLTWLSVGGSGMRATHTIPNLTREMQDLGIRTSVLLPIDFPVLSDNAHTWIEAAAGEGSLCCFGSVHPYTDHVEARLDRQLALGARGIKVHPAVQLVRPDWERCQQLYRLCGERGLPVLFHCGPVGIEPRLGRYLSQVRHYEAAISRNPGTLFILGHSGALQHEQALAFARTYENVYLELASQSLSAIRELLAHGPTDRILNGSDWPFYHQATAMAKVLLATEGQPGLRRRVLHDNAAALLRLGSPAAGSACQKPGGGPTQTSEN